MNSNATGILIKPDNFHGDASASPDPDALLPSNNESLCQLVDFRHGASAARRPRGYYDTAPPSADGGGFRRAAVLASDHRLNGVRQSDFVVMILGENYGTLQPSELSATHEEYREARGRKPVLAFVQQGIHPEPRQGQGCKHFYIPARCQRQSCRDPCLAGVELPNSASRKAAFTCHNAAVSLTT